MAQGAARLVQHLSQRHLDPFKLRQPTLPLGVWQRGEPAVLLPVHWQRSAHVLQGTLPHRQRGAKRLV